jgi:signal transduction histidine kinase
MELTLDDADLSGVLAEAIEMVGLRSEDSIGETRFVISRPLPTARCERARCREILLKLLSNALKCIDEPRKIIEVGCIGPGESHPARAAPKTRPARPFAILKTMASEFSRSTTTRFCRSSNMSMGETNTREGPELGSPSSIA